MLAQVGLGIGVALTFDINALVIAIMLVLYFVHEATAIWDVSVAGGKRDVYPVAQ